MRAPTSGDVSSSGAEAGAACSRYEEHPVLDDLSGYFRSPRLPLPQLRANALSYSSEEGGFADRGGVLEKVLIPYFDEWNLPGRGFVADRPCACPRRDNHRGQGSPLLGTVLPRRSMRILVRHSGVCGIEGRNISPNKRIPRRGGPLCPPPAFISAMKRCGEPDERTRLRDRTAVFVIPALRWNPERTGVPNHRTALKTIRRNDKYKNKVAEFRQSLPLRSALITGMTVNILCPCAGSSPVTMENPRTANAGGCNALSPANRIFDTAGRAMTHNRQGVHPETKRTGAPQRRALTPHSETRGGRPALDFACDC